VWDCTYDQCVVSPTAPDPRRVPPSTTVRTLDTFVIEDSPVIRQNLVSTLEDLTRVKVIGVADTEAEAVRVLSDLTLRVDLVIVDVILREGTGLGVLRRPELKRAGRHFVVLSNYATAEVRARALSLGASRVFDKSGEIDALIDFCENLLGRVDVPAARARGT
jgi:two-component system, OmpR family, response regulator